MSSPQDQKNPQQQGGQPQRGQPLFRQFRNEFTAVGPKQYMKTGFLPPPEPVNINLEDDEDNGKVFQAEDAENYGGRGLNPFQDGFEREAYVNPDEHPLPPPPGDTES
ncbi:hypothetical protein M9Y10_021786 [Tritrichomonas musculus]|uniref:Uncharacterized protein n=1 Tax=Tritrichomonas musculus TaxID=1915356 RepID=A0ABR2KQI4_9EUKA